MLPYCKPKFNMIVLSWLLFNYSTDMYGYYRIFEIIGL